MKNLFKEILSKKGFTLIELLIVIAILGVLAAGILVAIDPVEQLARGRDVGRLQGVGQLGRAASTYYTSQGGVELYRNALFSSTLWQTILVQSGDLKTVISAPSVVVQCSWGDSREGNFCYVYSRTVPNDFLIWTQAESKQYITKASGTNACPVGQAAYFIFDSTQGKSGVACNSTTGQPPPGIVLK